MGGRAFAVMLAALAIACARPAFDAASIGSRTLHDVVAVDGGELRMHTIAFPPRATTHPRRAPLVVVEPILWKRELLLRDGGLVSWLEDEGFPVWLVGSDADAPPDARTLSAGIARVIGTIGREARMDRVDVLAIAFGGPATMYALEPLTAPGSPVRVGKVVFFGAPLDLAYAGSFRSRVDVTLRALRDRDARAWLGAVPPPEPMETRPARERFPFATRFRDVPVLFVAGKADGVAPSESVFPAFALWGSEEKDPRAVPRFFFVVGRENGLDEDADGFDLVDGKTTATQSWERVAAFLGD